MKKMLVALISLALTATVCVAAETQLDKAAKEDIARHRAIAAAHEGAAKCLESGKTDEVCEKELQIACKGLAIGKFCGMKHEH